MLARISDVSQNDHPVIELQRHSPGEQSNVAAYFQHFRQIIYRFDAQRRPASDCGAKGSIALDRMAESLPFCVNHLQTSDPHGHRTLCEWVNRVFPNIIAVNAPPIGGTFQLRCHFHPPSARRDDLTVPMARMGAGIGNVLAMLYVVLTSRFPQVIAIDEPNAFLHPRALRELLAILESEGRDHQFILTAHSADVLTAVHPRTISLIELEGVSTKVSQVAAKDLHLLRGGLADLGIRVTDLHAHDRVLWVEGQTEELVMPELLRFACPELASGTAVLRVERTGTFSKKGISPHEIVQIYERLSASSALVPPMMCILLDGEGRTPEERSRVTAEARHKLRFLDRRMIENYLLDPEALTEVLNGLGHNAVLMEVRQALELAIAKHGGEDLINIDGAAVLSSVFAEVTGATVEFRKTRDVQVLVRWLIGNQPGRLAPLRRCLRDALDLSSGTDAVTA